MMMLTHVDFLLSVPGTMLSTLVALELSQFSKVNKYHPHLKDEKVQRGTDCPGSHSKSVAEPGFEPRLGRPEGLLSATSLDKAQRPCCWRRAQDGYR